MQKIWQRKQRGQDDATAAASVANGEGKSATHGPCKNFLYCVVVLLVGRLLGYSPNFPLIVDL